MVPLAVGPPRWAPRVVLGLLVLSSSAATPQDDPQAKRRLEFMRASVESLEPASSELKSKAALAVAPQPLLRYNDLTREGVKVGSVNVLVDAAVWRLGTEGRPAALLTVEIYQAPDGSRVLAYEFLSLTEAKFVLKHKTERVRWDATSSGLDLKELPDAPKPAATPAARLTQMRQMARRFAVTERLKDEVIECRLLAQPIDRYHSGADKIADGAIFALANGTNPEVGVVFESDGARWRYGLLRLGAAEMRVTLDGQQVAAFEKFDGRGRTDGAYNNAAIKIGADR
jgi:hypothetical protein